MATNNALLNLFNSVRDEWSEDERDKLIATLFKKYGVLPTGPLSMDLFDLVVRMGRELGEPTLKRTKKKGRPKRLLKKYFLVAQVNLYIRNDPRCARQGVGKACKALKEDGEYPKGRDLKRSYHACMREMRSNFPEAFGAEAHMRFYPEMTTDEFRKYGEKILIDTLIKQYELIQKEANGG